MTVEYFNTKQNAYNTLRKPLGQLDVAKNPMASVTPQVASGLGDDKTSLIKAR